MYILIAFIDALYLAIRNLATFRFRVKIKATIDAYGCDKHAVFAVFRQSGLSYRRRFPVVYLTLKVMLRPRIVDKQLEVYAFYVDTHREPSLFKRGKTCEAVRAESKCCEIS